MDLHSRHATGCVKDDAVLVGPATVGGSIQAEATAQQRWTHKVSCPTVQHKSYCEGLCWKA
jgi:hypothetical protein